MAMSNLTPIAETQARRRAHQRVRARLGLIGHGVIYMGVTVLLLALNIAATPDNMWFFWPMLAWLPALVGHGVFVLGPGLQAIERWTDREYEREVERITGGPDGNANGVSEE